MKRIIGKILVQDKLVVNSYGYGNYRPCSTPYESIRRLRDWQIDEILILNRSHSLDVSLDYMNLFPSEKHREIALDTPITYGGGVSRASASEIEKLIKLGVERLVLNFHQFKTLELLQDISKICGVQSIVLHIPYIMDNKIAKCFSRCSESIELKSIARELDGWGGEVLITDLDNEGSSAGIRQELLKTADLFNNCNVIVSGGVSSSGDLEKIFADSLNISGAVVGNFLNQKELALSLLKGARTMKDIRNV